jgi:hypothetical protein
VQAIVEFLGRMTPATCVDLDRMLEQPAEVWVTGMAFDRGEWRIGAWGARCGQRPGSR